MDGEDNDRWHWKEKPLGTDELKTFFFSFVVSSLRFPFSTRKMAIANCSVSCNWAESRRCETSERCCAECRIFRKKKWKLCRQRNVTTIRLKSKEKETEMKTEEERCLQAENNSSDFSSFFSSPSTPSSTILFFRRFMLWLAFAFLLFSASFVRIFFYLRTASDDNGMLTLHNTICVDAFVCFCSREKKFENQLKKTKNVARAGCLCRRQSRASIGYTFCSLAFLVDGRFLSSRAKNARCKW